MHVDTLVIGSGPAALATAVALHAHDPDRCRPERLVVVDPSGRWLATWDAQMAAQRIRHLRSPAVHHPGLAPFDLYHAVSAADLTRPDGLDLPRVDAFRRFCESLISSRDLHPVVRPGKVESAEVDDQGVTARLEDGEVVRADQVVVATNPRARVLPPWAAAVPRSSVRVGGRLGADVAQRRVLVVGGGLSAAHLALGAASDGAHVTLIARRDLVCRRMDVDPRWLGPARLRPFLAMDAERRSRAVFEARGGGSIPRWALRALTRSDVEVWAPDEVRTAWQSQADEGIQVATDAGRRGVVDEVWLATGGPVDVRLDPVLDAACRHSPIPIHRGLPDLGSDLRWGSAPVWVAGAAAALRIGPVAGILYGHREAGRLIAPALASHRTQARPLVAR